MTNDLKYPTLDEMYLKLKETAPDRWSVLDDFHFISVYHYELSEEQFISFGNVNGHFGFNDVFADPICGDMEGIYNPDEIAKNFWFQVKEFYPELFKEAK